MMNNKNIEADQLINWSALSQLLTGLDSYIHKNRIPNGYKKEVEILQNAANVLTDLVKQRNQSAQLKICVNDSEYLEYLNGKKEHLETSPRIVARINKMNYKTVLIKGGYRATAPNLVATIENKIINPDTKNVVLILGDILKINTPTNK